MGGRIIRGTTPTVTMTCDDASIDLRTLGEPCVTIRQGHVMMKFDDTEQTEHSLSFEMTQRQTLSLDAGRDDRTCEVQVNWMKDGVRNASDKVRVAVYGNLDEGVMA